MSRIDATALRAYRGDVDAIRTFRVPEQLWNDAMAAASERGESASDVIRRALDAYARSRKPVGNGAMMVRRTARVPDATWQAATKAAEKHGEPVGAVVRAALEAYCAEEAR